MLPDLTVMTVDAAVALMTLLTVVLFAYLLEFARVTRGLPDSGPRGNRRWWMLGFMIGICLASAVTFIYLLGAINAGGIEGTGAITTWLVAGSNAFFMVVYMLVFAITD